MKHLFRRVLLSLGLVAATMVGGVGTAAVAAADPLTGPVTSIRADRCSVPTTYFAVYVNQRLTWCVGGAGTLNPGYQSVTQVRTGDNVGTFTYRNFGSNTTITQNFVRNGTYNLRGATIYTIVIK